MKIVIEVTDTNIAGGFKCYGPFENDQMANDWADDTCQNQWWIVPLENPSGDCIHEHISVREGDSRTVICDRCGAVSKIQPVWEY